MTKADIIITNANVFTADAATPRAGAVAVKGRDIAFVGSAEEAEDWRGPGTRVIDGQGSTLMPGFIDCHYHLFKGSLDLGNILLDQVRDFDSFKSAVLQFAGDHPDDPWLIGNGLRYSIIPDDERPIRHHLDAIIANRPLIVMAYDFHTAWANTEALRRAGLLDHGEPVAPNSVIVRDEQGQATGELRESGAYDPLLNLIPPPGEARKYELLKMGLAQAAALGITGVHNMDGDAGQLARYAALADVGELTLRVYVPFDIRPNTPPSALAEAVAMRQSCQGDMVRSGCVKFFMDGVVESYTALLLDDYAGQPGYRGGANFDLEHFIEMAVAADRLGLQIFVHAVGDGAVRRTLDGYAAVQQTNGRRDSRHRIEHIELVHSGDLPRFKELGVIASMQPDHAILTLEDQDPWPHRIHEAHWGDAFAWQKLRQAGARLAFGSDWPVVGQSPFRGLYAGLNRNLWRPGLPDQRQTLAEMLLGYTRDAAYAEFQEDRKGQLRPGLLADMVLLPADLFSLPPEELAQVRPVLTMCDGRIVYEA